MNERQRYEYRRRQRDLALAEKLERTIQDWEQVLAEWVAAGGELPPDWPADPHQSTRELVQRLRAPYEAEGEEP